MNIVFFSDAHLLREDEAKISYVAGFLDNICRDADTVFVMGDIFEFYHGYDGYIYPWYRPVVDALSRIGRTKETYYIEGNHEFQMGSFFESLTGIRCLTETSFTVDGRRLFLSHGDEIGAFPMRTILKSRPILSLMDLLGPSLTWTIAMGCRTFLSKRTKAYKDRVRDRFRSYATSILDKGYDAVVLGHSHMPDLVEYEGRGARKVYLNTGSLIESQSYGHYGSEKGFTLKTYEGVNP